MSLIDIKMFPASYGDSFLVTCNGERTTHILIDMGFASTYNNYIKDQLKELSKRGDTISLLVITHIDEDHILGGIKFLEDNGSCCAPNIIAVEEVWYNSYKNLLFKNNVTHDDKEKKSNDTEEFLVKLVEKGHGKEHGVRKVSDISYKQGSTFAGLLYKNGYTEKWNKLYNFDAVLVERKEDTLKTILINNTVKLTVLSPERSNLEKLGQAWESKIVDWGFGDKLLSGELTDEAFEVYVANELDKQKKSRKVKKISGEQKEIDIEAIANESFTPDQKIVNGSSIAFILEFMGKKVLFLGDAHSDTIELNLKKLLLNTNKERICFDAVKVSHHGSKYNMSKSLFDLIDTEKYIISTNGYIKQHPDIETISRIITSNKEKMKKIIFNYKPNFLEEINKEHLKKQFNFELEYSNDVKKGIKDKITTISIV